MAKAPPQEAPEVQTCTTSVARQAAASAAQDHSRPADPAPDRDRMTDSTGEWKWSGDRTPTNGGKNAHVRVRRVDNAEVTMAHERINVKRATAEEGKR